MCLMHVELNILEIYFGKNIENLIFPRRQMIENTTIDFPVLR